MDYVKFFLPKEQEDDYEFYLDVEDDDDDEEVSHETPIEHYKKEIDTMRRNNCSKDFIDGYKYCLYINLHINLMDY